MCHQAVSGMFGGEEIEASLGAAQLETLGLPVGLPRCALIRKITHYSLAVGRILRRCLPSSGTCARTTLTPGAQHSGSAAHDPTVATSVEFRPEGSDSAWCHGVHGAPATDFGFQQWDQLAYMRLADLNCNISRKSFLQLSSGRQVDLECARESGSCNIHRGII